MNILDRFSLALSYREKAESDYAGWLKIRETDSFDHSQYDLVKSRYERHIEQASELTDIIRSSQEASIPELGVALRALGRRQKKILEAISAGKLKPKQANVQNRDIAKEQSRYEEILDWAKQITEANSTEDLEGFIDISFEEYEERLGITDEVEIPPPPKREFSVKNVVVIVLIGVIVWAGWSYNDLFGKASWRAESADHNQVMRIRCSNTGDKTIRVFAPWPDGNTDSEMSPKLSRSTFGILLYVRERGKSNYQMLPDSTGYWKKNAEKHDSVTPITIRAGGRVDITLNVLELRQLGIKVDVVRVEYTRHGGRVVGRYEMLLM
jgi:hypothetical protein